MRPSGIARIWRGIRMGQVCLPGACGGDVCDGAAEDAAGQVAVWAHGGVYVAGIGGQRRGGAVFLSAGNHGNYAAAAGGLRRLIPWTEVFGFGKLLSRLQICSV